MQSDAQSHEIPVYAVRRWLTGGLVNVWGNGMRTCVILLGIVLCYVSTNVQARAGCHYGDGRSFLTSSEPLSPNAHVRNFRFLGQWIYEAGEVKYVPWQGSPPCHGPECQAKRQAQPETGSPVSDTQRLPLVAWNCSATAIACSTICSLGLPSDSLAPFAGYPHEYEYPP